MRPGDNVTPSACKFRFHIVADAIRIVMLGWLCPWRQIARAASQPVEAVQRSTIQAGCALATPLPALSLCDSALAAASLRSTAFTMPEANRWPACFAISTLSSIAARAGMRSMCSN